MVIFIAKRIWDWTVCLRLLSDRLQILEEKITSILLARYQNRVTIELGHEDCHKL